MKVRKKDLCDTCRKRKLQCDGKRPSCTQCILSNRTCEGYPDALFVHFVATKPALEPRTTSFKSTSRTAQSVSTYTQCSSFPNSASVLDKDSTITSRKDTGLSDALPSSDRYYTQGLGTIQNKVALILYNFIPLHEMEFNLADPTEQCSQFCGSWAKALPQLAADIAGPFSQCLHSAVSALALSITAYRNRQNLLDAIVTQYEESLRVLGQSLAATANTCDSRLLAAVMCLALTEVLSPTQESSWLVHVEGVTNMVQLMSPEPFASGIEHIMFVGFRPLLILRAFIIRKPTFFANESWLTLPFRRHQPAPLQSLLCAAAHIPGVLEKIDAIIPRSCDRAAATADQLITELLGSILRLKSWHDSFLASTTEVLYCSRYVEHGHGSTFESLWYPSLGIANAFVYFWAFQLICLNEIQDLLDRFPHIKHTIHDGAAYSAGAFREESLELSTSIYKSMEYLLHADFMLYGISSAGFPLSIACKTLQSDAKGRAILESLDPSIIIRSRVRGQGDFVDKLCV